MKKKQRKTVRKQLARGVVALIALGFAFGTSVDAAEKLPRKLPSVQHEMVPHVVLPETIQYDPVAKSTSSLQSGPGQAGAYGNASPYVATYTAFPSYVLPNNTEMRTVGQSVYPVTPPQAIPLPKAKPENDEESTLDQLGMDLEKLDFIEGDTEAAPILLASGQEEIVPATPLSLWENDIMQTGIFCQKPAKPPAAWSFTSPIFKAASVPMGWGGASHGGYITQTGPRGCMSQVGFNPGGGMAPQGGMMQPPMSTFQSGQQGMPQAYTLPNGMTLLTMPPDHSRCGVLRCRCGNSPRMMLLPGAPGGMPMQQPMMPGMMPGTDTTSMMMSYPMQGGMMQPGMMMPQQGMMSGMMGMPPQMQMQIQPVMAMTPYGMSVVGYQQIPHQAPMMNPMMAAMAAQVQAQQGPMPGQMQGMMNVGMNPMTGNMVIMGNGMMPAEYARQMMQMQQAGQAGDVAAKGTTEEGQAEQSEGLKTPLSIHANPMAAMMQGQYANPYAMYANQAAVQQQNPAVGTDSQCAQQAMMPMMMPPLFFQPGMQSGMMTPAMNGYEFSGMYMTPYGMMTMNQAMPMNGYSMGYGMMPGMMNVGMGGQADMNRGVTMADLMQLMTMMNNQKAEPRRFRLFQRLAERREARRAGHAQHDPFQDLMSFWTSPYTPADTAMRMPSRNAYPYGYFGAQVAPQSTANYGGYYNLYMGNTTYPGTSGLY